jgi:hypothetical protein
MLGYFVDLIDILKLAIDLTDDVPIGIQTRAGLDEAVVFVQGLI